jgi:hypothetical protein
MCQVQTIEIATIDDQRIFKEQIQQIVIQSDHIFLINLFHTLFLTK